MTEFLSLVFTGPRIKTYIDQIFIVSDEEIPEDSCLVKISEADHVLDTLDGGRVHGLDPPLRSEPQLIPVIVNDLEEIKQLIVVKLR